MRFIDPMGLERLEACCNEWDMENIQDYYTQLTLLQQSYVRQSEFPAPLPWAPSGMTNCNASTVAGPFVPVTRYWGMGRGTCIDACLRVHEQWHRDECRRDDYFALEQGRAYWTGEALAYASEADCVKQAIYTGRVSVDVDPLGPDNQ